MEEIFQEKKTQRELLAVHFKYNFKGEKKKKKLNIRLAFSYQAGPKPSKDVIYNSPSLLLSDPKYLNFASCINFGLYCKTKNAKEIFTKPF